MERVRELICLMFAASVGVWGATTVSLGTYDVEQGSTVAVRVAVTCPELKELQVSVAWDPALAQIVPGSLWVNASRLHNAWDPGATAVPADFMTVLAADHMVFFRLHQSAEIGDSGWRVGSEADGGPQTSVFGFSLQGLARGTAALTFPALYPPYARNTSVFYPDEAMTAVAGSVLVYRPAGPVQITPAGGSYNHAIEVAVDSEYSTRLVYTLDGSIPDADSAELPAGQALYLDGADGQLVPLRVLAFGEAGAASAGAADFSFDMAVPAVTVTPLVTAASRPTLRGTVSESGATVRVTVSGVTATAVNDGGGGWSLDLSAVLAEALPEGVYDVAAVATDAAGNSGGDATSGELAVDRTPPQGGFTIGAGGPLYVARVVTVLEVSVNGAVEMRFRNPGEEWGAWRGYVPEEPWVLSAGDGSKTVEGEFRDVAGNLLALADGVGLDTGLPVSAIATAGPYGPLTWPGEIGGTATDALSGVGRVEAQCVRSDSGEYWTGSAWTAVETWIVASGMTPWSVELDAGVLPAETVLTLRSRAVDRAGNVQLPADQSTFSYDGTAPTGGVSIEAVDTVAVSAQAVTLVCSVAGAAQMRFREGTGAWTGWLPFAPTHPWTLSDGDGQKVVQAAFADAAWNLLELSDGVLLDRVAPVTTVSTVGGYGPASWAGMVSGTVLDATSGVAGVALTVRRHPEGEALGDYWNGTTWVASEPWLPATLVGGAWSVSLPLAALQAGGDARNYTVTARAEDPAGNLEAPAVTSGFLFDSRIPAGGFSIGAGNPLWLNAVSVTLVCSVTAANPLEMRFRNEGEAFPSAWSTYAGTVPVVLPAGNGMKTVFGEFRDTLSGNTLATSDAVTLDGDAPGSTLATAGAFSPVTWPGSIAGTAADVGPAGIDRVELAILRGDGLYWHGSGWQAAEVRLSVAVVAGSWAYAFPAGLLSDATTYFLSSRAADRAGNLQANPAAAVVSYDSSAPVGSFAIGSGNPIATPTRGVALAVAVSGATEMSFRNVGGAWSAWEAIAPVRPGWQLIGGDGVKQVSGRFRDAVGNLYETDDTIVYDSTAPGSMLSLASAYGPASWPGGISGTATDTLSGVARVEVRVQRGSDGAFWGGSTWGVLEVWLVASGSTSWQLPLASGQLLSGVTYSVGGRAVDVAGNVQSAAAVGSFLYDAGLPSSAVTTPGLVGFQSWPGAVEGTAADGLGEVQAVEVKVIRVLGAAISTWDGAAWQPGIDAPWLAVQGTQTWRLPLALSTLSHGASYTVTSRATDRVGNVQAPPTSQTIVFDGEAPDAPVLSGVAADSGTAGDLVTNDRTLSFSGQAEAGSMVEVRLGGATIGTALAGAGGTWALDHSGTALAAGAHALELAATDAAGNRSLWSTPRTLLIDTVAPVLTCGFAAGVRLNGSATISFTTDGLGAVGASFDQNLWTPVQSGVSTLGDVAGFGAQPQGAMTLFLRDSDVAGNVGRVQVSLLKDTAAPAGYGLSINQDRINALNRHALTFALAGAEPGATCAYTISSTGGAVVAGDFAVLAATQISPAISVDLLDDGLLTVAALLRDAVGNTGGAVSDQVVKDTVAPSGYSVHIEPVFINAAGQTQFTFVIPGAEVGAICQYTVQSAGGGTPVVGSATVPAAPSRLGPLSVAGLQDGTLTLAAYLTDASGNSGPVASHQVLKDTLAPTVPLIETLTQPVNQATAAVFACAGQAEAGATVLYRIVSSAGPQAVEGTAVATGDSRFAVSGADVTSLGDGTLTVTVSGRDAADNQSAYSAGRAVVKDTELPAAPLLSSVTATVNAATVAEFAFAGTGEPGATVVYTLASASAATELSGSLAVGAGGSFSLSGLNVAPLPDGVLLLRVRQRDAVGNPSPEVSSAPLTKDTTLPTLTLDSPPASGHLNGDEVFRFSASEPAAVQASLDGVTWTDIVSGTTTVQDLPQFAALADVPFTVTLTVTDAAGNVAAYNRDFRKDTTGPTGYDVVFVEGFVDLSSTGTLAFMILAGELGSAFSYEVVDTAGGRGTVSGSGTIATVPQTVSGVAVAALAQGGLTLRLWLTDVAGNAGQEVFSETTLGTTQVLTLVYGWNAFGVVVAALDSVASIVAEGAGREDGALARGMFHGYRGGAPVVLVGIAVPEFGCAYRVFASRPGTLRLRGVAGVGIGNQPAGWAYVAPGADLLVVDFPASWSVWADAEPGRGYRPLLDDTQVPAGSPIWVHVAP